MDAMIPTPERELPAEIEHWITTLQNYRFMRWQNEEDWGRAFRQLRQSILAALEPERALLEDARLTLTFAAATTMERMEMAHRIFVFLHPEDATSSAHEGSDT